jgi:hypothetical protein
MHFDNCYEFTIKGPMPTELCLPTNTCEESITRTGEISYNHVIHEDTTMYGKSPLEMYRVDVNEKEQIG